MISSFGAHHGEETPLSGWRGSGTIFFTSCNLKCAFCQNYEISQLRHGREIGINQLSDLMFLLQEQGCHNINLVTPTHYIPHIVSALITAVDAGLTLPIVYNCGGYESVETLRLLEGIIDIYMPDIKYSDDAIATRYSGAPGYWSAARDAVREMHRQVGDLWIDDQGLAVRGLLVRHLVLPNRLAGSMAVVDFVADDISLNTYLNIMDQFRPAYRAGTLPELNRSVASNEYSEVVDYALSRGLKRGFTPINRA